VIGTTTGVGAAVPGAIGTRAAATTTVVATSRRRERRVRRGV
jgi:hypothetical protein